MSRFLMAALGVFAMVWGGWLMAERLGYIPDGSFAFWPLFLVLGGALFLVAALTGRGWGMWCGTGWEGEGQERADGTRR